ncbi:MAG: response regulator transcription factor [Pikeienuella sp.]
MQSPDPQAAPILISLADGNPLVLSGMAELFERDPRFSLVATSATAEGFLGMAMRAPVHVGVIEWNLPVLGGQKLIEVMREQTNAPRFVVYGDDPRGETPRLAMLSGAAGFVARTTPVEKLLDTCAAVAQGPMVFPFLDIRELQADPIHSLTRRERALLEALSRGLTNKDLARDFGISTNTVKYHLSNLFEKLGVSNRAQAIAFYYSARRPDEGPAPR